MSTEEPKEATGLELMREPFPANQIGKLPKPTASQTKEVKDNFKNGARCGICGGWHHPKVVHLDYVGHAALTDRLLSADLYWNWEPLSFKDGLPAFDSLGGLWIKLTVKGITRLGYGNAASSTFKEIGSREKEIIGDALRNAAMRFGGALELWHKGELHVEEPNRKEQVKEDKALKEKAKEQEKAIKEEFKTIDFAKKVDDAIQRFIKTSNGYKTLAQWDSAIESISKNNNRVSKDHKFINTIETLYHRVLKDGVEVDK